MKKLFVAAMISIMALPSCELREITFDGQESENLVQVSFLPSSFSSKGSLEDMLVEDVDVANMSVAIYDSKGMLYYSKYFESKNMDDFTVDLCQASKYVMYMLANTGEFDIPLEMEEMDAYVYELENIHSLVKYSALPLAAKVDIDTAKSTEYDVELVKLAAEISLNFDCPDDFTIELTSVIFKSVPMTITPFKENVSPTLRAQGDYDAVGECLELHDGQTVSFLIPEDMSSANALPPASAITAPAAGTPMPANISYIEVSGTVSNTAGIKTADIKYNILLDYKITRNKKYNISFSVTEAGLFENTYRISVANAKLDIDESIVMFVGQTADLSCKAMDYDNLEYSVGNSSILTVDSDQGTAYAKQAGTTTITIYSPALGAETICSVRVLNLSDDDSFLGTINEAYVAQRFHVPVIATWGGELTITATRGSTKETFSLDMNNTTDAQTGVNSYVEVEYDPSSQTASSTKYFTLTTKKACTLNMKLASASGKIIDNSVSVSYPRITVYLSDTAIKEYQYTDFSAHMIDKNGLALTKDDFVESMYDTYYGTIKLSLSNTDAAKIWKYDASTGQGIVTAWNANGTSRETVFRASYSGSVAYINYRAGVLTVKPAFGEVISTIDDIENNVYITDNAATIDMTVKNIASIYDLPRSEVRVRHLKWDGAWENGTTVPTSELKVKLITHYPEWNLKLNLGADASGPYAIRLVMVNNLTRKEYYKEIRFNVYLMLECGPHVEWNEWQFFDCDIEMIWNLHPSASSSVPVSAFPLSSSDKYIGFSYTGDPSKSTLPAAMNRYAIGDVIQDWVSQYTYTKKRQADADAENCEIFYNCVCNYNLQLYNPLYNTVCEDRYFYTDQAFAEAKLDGKPYLYGITLNKKGMLMTMGHRCSISQDVESDLYGE